MGWVWFDYTCLQLRKGAVFTHMRKREHYRQGNGSKFLDSSSNSMMSLCLYIPHLAEGVNQPDC